jgi:uncharacterized damage-inducible protein DinB
VWTQDGRPATPALRNGKDFVYATQACDIVYRLDMMVGMTTPKSAIITNPRPPVMFVDSKNDLRENIDPKQSDERATLVSHLRWHRQTLELKCDGLDAADLARRCIEPSTMSLLGIVRHMAEVERRWFRLWMAGQDAPPHFYSATDPEGDFEGAAPDPEVVEESFKAWRDEIAFSESFVAGAPNLDVLGNIPHEGPVSLREVLVHVIEEYARHIGHADLFRERIDGRIGI